MDCFCTLYWVQLLDILIILSQLRPIVMSFVTFVAINFFFCRSYVAVFRAMSLRRNFLALPQASFKDIYHF